MPKERKTKNIVKQVGVLMNTEEYEQFKVFKTLYESGTTKDISNGNVFLQILKEYFDHMKSLSKIK